MDALAGYGSSDSSDNDYGDDNKPKSALSGLLANLSDASDDDDAHAHAADAADNGCEESNEPPKKKMRRGDDEVVEDHDSELSHPQQHIILPPPQLLVSINTVQDDDNDINIDTDPFQSLIVSTKDYTSELRQSLAQQLQAQTCNMSEKQKRLADKLKLLKEQTSSSSSSSFASHLKSKQEFGNPHLLKDVIDHFQIIPLDSSKQQFKPFEFLDRLQLSEEKARIAAANYNAGQLP